MRPVSPPRKPHRIPSVNLKVIFKDVVVIKHVNIRLMLITWEQIYVAYFKIEGGHLAFIRGEIIAVIMFCIQLTISKKGALNFSDRSVNSLMLV